MNWFKIAQQKLPIDIVSYIPAYGELGISFNGGKRYIYPNVNPYFYEKIRTLLKYKNYKKVREILKDFSVSNPNSKEEDREEIIQELIERGYLK